MMGQEHLRNLALVPGSTVTRLFEPDDGMAARSLALAPGATRVPSLEDVVRADDVDALVITSPNFRHAEQLQRIAELRGLPVLLEKPACTELSQVAELRALASTHPAPLWVAMEYRYMPPVAELVRLVHDGAVGIPRMVAIREHRFPFLVKVGDWNRFSANTGGTLVEKTCHFFDLMNLILGERPLRVMASGGQDVNHLDESYDGRVPDVLDNAFVIVDYPSGARAMLDLCMFAEATHDQEEMSVVGELGKVEARIPSDTVHIGRRGEHWIGAVESYPVHDPSIGHEGLHHGSSWVEHVKFLEAVRHGTKPEVTLDDGYWAVATGVAAHRSIELGRPVHLAEVMRAGATDTTGPRR